VIILKSWLLFPWENESKQSPFNMRMGIVLSKHDVLEYKKISCTPGEEIT
jgi:hypothetical protein